MTYTQQNSLRYLGGFAAGLALGAVAAILLAPRAGRETRELLGQKAQDLKDKTKDMFQRSKSSLGETAIG